MRRALLLTSLTLLAACSEASVSPPPGATPAAGDAGTRGGPRTPELEVRVHEENERRVTDAVTYGEQFSLHLRNLTPGTEVTVRAQSHYAAKSGRAYVAEATFAVRADGIVDTADDAPVRGSYAGADADGLLWSMTEQNAPEGLTSDVYAAQFVVSLGSQVLFDRLVPRRASGPNVTCKDVKENGIVGSYCAPSGSARRTPVLAFGGSEGGTFSGTAQSFLFATWGIPTLGIAYFGAPGLPPSLANIPLEYFEKAMQWLDGRPEALPGETIVAGGSRGGELALLLGATYLRVKGVIADVPSAYVWGAVDGSAPAWTHTGTAVPFVPDSPNALAEKVKGPGGASAWRTTPYFERSIADAPKETLAAATIPVAKIGGPVLALAGAGDDLWPSCGSVRAIVTTLQNAGHSKAYPADMGQCYDDAGHSLTFAGSPTTGANFSQTPQGWLALGGTARGIAAAQRDAFNRRRAFLRVVSRVQ